jgi:flagellin FlaB
MTSKLRRVLRDERGITALETAIILIAFVVVAAVLAYTILSAGIFATERGKEAIYAGIEEVRGSMELRGSMIAEGDTVAGKVTKLIFTVANVAGGEPIDLTEPPNNVMVISYRDENQHHTNITWSKAWLGKNDGDELLEMGELAEITIDLTAITGFTPTLGTNTVFAIEVKPGRGASLILERTTPARIDKVMDLE